MSENDGGPCVRVYRETIPKPRIPRGILKVVLDPIEPTPQFEAGARIDFDRLIEDDKGATCLVTYHGARFVGFSEGEMTVDVVPDTVVTWEAYGG